MAGKATPARIRNDGPAGAREPLFTLKELMAYVALCSVYAVILFSLDPEWVGWAGPLVLGGALSATDAPPGPPVFGSPKEAMEMGSILSVLSLVCLFLPGLFAARRADAGRRAWARGPDEGHVGVASPEDFQVVHKERDSAGDQRYSLPVT
jgi:hypothetical protein